MLKKLLISIALFALSALVLTACGGTETTNGNSNNTATDNKTATTSTPKAADTPAPTTSSANDDKIGIAECDDYLAKYEACVSGKVPEAARAQYKASLDQVRKSWRGLAANPNTKSGLKMACETAATQAKEQFKMYGCDF